MDAPRESVALALRVGLDLLEERQPYPTLDLGALERAARAAERYIRESDPPATRRVLLQHWHGWAAHCRMLGVSPLPVDPRQLVLHLTARSLELGHAPNTIRSALNALSVIDQRARATERDPKPDSVRYSPIVRAWYKGWTRENPYAPLRQAASVTGSQLELVLQRAQERPRSVSASHHIAAYSRDRAMLLLGLTAAMRVSEIVALDVAHVTQHDRGLKLFFPRSKVDQEGRGAWAAVVPQAHLLRCPVDAWLTWLRVRGDWPGPAFVAISRAGELERTRMHETAARKIVKRRADAAGLSLTSHSLRASFATLAVEHRKPLPLIAQQGRWKSMNTLKGYVRQGELFDNNPSAGILDDD